MPYFIDTGVVGCSGWALLKENGDIIGCHTNKQDAIDHMVAISLAEGIEPGGQRAESTNSVRALPENYRPALSPDVPEGRACGNCYFYDESNVQGDKAWCERWDDYVDGAYYCNAWQPDENSDDGEETYVMPEARAIDVPQFLQDNARRGLDWLNEGFAGDGVTDKTISEARQMSRGIISEDKAARMGPWFARHMSDLTGTDRNTQPPTAGMVAHALWGGWPAQESRRAMEWAETQVMNVEENGRHMTNKIETRRVTINDFDIRESGDGMSFAGYAAVFDSPSEPLPFLETIRAGAFAKSLKSRNNVMMLWSHDTSQPLASTRSKTMRLYEDTRGLMVEADLPQTSLGRDVSELLRARVVDSMSFGFSVPRNGDVWSADGMTRELVEVRLHEVSVVAFPAYAKTSASVRSLDVLADRIGTDASVLSSALDALESGDTLTRDQATLLASVVDTLSPDAEPVQELVTDFDVKVKLAVLKDMIDLTYKSL
jgi:HK97 family phage prohead protease